MSLIPDDDRIFFIKILISFSTYKLIRVLSYPQRSSNILKLNIPEIFKNPLPYEYCCQNNYNKVHLMYFRNHKNK